MVELPLRLPPPKAAPTKNRMALAGSMVTPSLLEGTYRVKITKGKETFEHDITLQPDPESLYSAADRKMQQQTLKTLYDMTNRLGYIYHTLEDIEKQAKALTPDANQFKEKLTGLAEEVEKYKGSLVSLDGDFYVAEGEEALREEISTLYYSVSTFPGKPSERQVGKTVQLQQDFVQVEEKFTGFQEQAAALDSELKPAQLKILTWKTFEDYLN